MERPASGRTECQRVLLNGLEPTARLAEMVASRSRVAVRDTGTMVRDKSWTLESWTCVMGLSVGMKGGSEGKGEKEGIPRDGL